MGGQQGVQPDRLSQLALESTSGIGGGSVDSPRALKGRDFGDRSSIGNELGIASHQVIYSHLSCSLQWRLVRRCLDVEL